MTRHRILGSALALSLVATTSFAQTKPAAAAPEKTVVVGFQGNWSDAADFGLGARAIFSLDRYVKHVELHATFDYFFPSGGDDTTDSMGVWSIDQKYMSFGLNAVKSFSLNNTTARPYAGLGLNIARHSLQLVTCCLWVIPWVPIDGTGTTTASDTSTVAGVNVVAGVTFKKHFFAEARYEINDFGTCVITGGVRF
jgi:hypothetical protein